MNKNHNNSTFEFMVNLSSELDKFKILPNEKEEILNDFERHFEEGISHGLTEQQISENLGDVKEIASQYNEQTTNTDSKFKSEKLKLNFEEFANVVGKPSKGINEAIHLTHFMPAVRNQASEIGDKIGSQVNEFGNKVDIGGLIGILALDIFVFSWAIPALFSVILGYFSIVISFFGTGIALVLGVPISFVLPLVIDTSISTMGMVFLGIAFLALSGLGGILGISIAKGFIGCIKSIIDLHGMWICGKKVFTPKSTQLEESECSETTEISESEVSA
ncbi:MAG: DUF1700 domain-containing protein [Oscillospiraceae bacterium]|nr:DUF1700 domain-containing protein [Oscillospiraceae bacterium]